MTVTKRVSATASGGATIRVPVVSSQPAVAASLSSDPWGGTWGGVATLGKVWGNTWRLVNAGSAAVAEAPADISTQRLSEEPAYVWDT